MKAIPRSALEELSTAEIFQKVADICATVNVVGSTAELLEISLKETMELFGAVRGSIFILSDNGKDLILKISQGMKSDEQQSMVRRMGEGIVGQVAESKQPIWVDDIAQDSRFRNFKARKGYSTNSFICAPLMVKDQLIGIINIADKESGHNFNKNDMQLLDFLATQIALNYKRVQLYQKFKSVIQETRDLKDKLGKSDKEAEHLKKQVYIHERLATIGKLAGGIAHEFNNPLDGVIRYTNLCLEHVKDDEVVRGYLLEIKQGLNRMANIVRNLLACSRSETLKPERIELSKVLDHVIAGLQTDIAHKDIQIVKQVPNGLPLIQDLGVERILFNLMRNALDAVNDQGTIIVTVSQRSENEIKLTVSDSGCGIPKDDIDKVFEPFFTTKDIDKGCGLGLTIVAEIVKSYDGKISVESEINKGTTFNITLPIK